MPIAKKTISKKTPSKKSAFLPQWESFSEAVTELISRMLNRKVYNRAQYYSDLSWLLAHLANTNYDWFTESKINWEVISDELERMSKELGGDLKFTVPMGTLNEDMYHYANRFEHLVRQMQFAVETEHLDWYKSATGQPLPLNEIAKLLVKFTSELLQECEDHPQALLRSADRKWCLQAHTDLNQLYRSLGIDPLFDMSDFGPGGPNPWSQPG